MFDGINIEKECAFVIYVIYTIENILSVTTSVLSCAELNIIVLTTDMSRTWYKVLAILAAGTVSYQSVIIQKTHADTYQHWIVSVLTFTFSLIIIRYNFSVYSFNGILKSKKILLQK